MKREDFCKRCSRYAGCGFISRNLQTKCDILQIFEEGYEQGYEEAIDKACDSLYEYNRKQANKMFGTVHTADVTINVADFRNAMKGE